MGSLIPRFEYDIFISYRQKDNKGDRWVSEFVEALKTELESTFKEDISLYFDINPHDGLLETHDVDASLKDKLKCLIFIPIISRTYCDPKSFAWEHEFKAFIDQVSKDQFGLKVKLPNGNVATRILPIQIHELHPEDKSLLEKELGGVLRAIEFIYKEQGVNRPLTANDDNDVSQGRPKYRNQINKVANAIDEIINCLKDKQTFPAGRKLSSDQLTHGLEEDKSKEVSTSAMTAKKSKRWLIIALSILLCIVGVFALYKVINSGNQAENVSKQEKSIAVLPFKLLSDEPDKQYLADGMMDAITLHLSKIKDLRVMSRTSVEQYQGTTKTARQIGKELDVEYLLEGSFQKFGDNAKLIVQLIKAGEESHAWGNEYNSKWSDVFSLQSKVAQSIARELDAAISPEEKELIEKTPTSSLSAYDLYMMGNQSLSRYKSSKDLESYNKTLTFYRTALEMDSSYAKVYTGLADLYINRYFWETYFRGNFMDTCLYFAEKAIAFDSQEEEAYYLKGYYYRLHGDMGKAIEEYDIALKINPNYSLAYIEKGFVLTWYLHDFVKGIQNYENALMLVHGNERPDILRQMGRAYLDAGFVEKARNLYLDAYSIDGLKVRHYMSLFWLEMCDGNFEEAINLTKMAMKIDTSIYPDLFIFSIVPGKENDAYILARKIIARRNRTGSLPLITSHRIGYALYRAGQIQNANYYFDQQIKYGLEEIKLGRPYAQRRQAHYDLALTYAFLGEKDKAYQYLEEVVKLEFFQLWWITLIKNEPMFENIRNEERFQKIINDMVAKHNTKHESVKRWLEEQGKI